MRILTHNMLCCLKCDQFPLQIKAEEKVEDVEEEPDLQFIVHMLNRLDYEAIKSAARNLDIHGLPDQLPTNIEQNEVALKALHRLLVQVRIKKGELICGACGRVYPIMKNGIPNMLLREDELAEKKKRKKASQQQPQDIEEDDEQ